ncbi:MAG TPA: glycosyltransferase, partial [bacterium]|nr:glycosyltransferase [bacterium]
AASLPRDEFTPIILTIKPVGPLHRLARQAGIPAHSLRIESRGEAFFALLRLLRFLLAQRPEILHTFLFGANLLGRLAGWTASVPLIISSQRSTDPWRRSYHNLLDKITGPMCRLVVSNSEAGRQMLLKKADLPPEKVITIPNGVETVQPVDRDRARAALGFTPDQVVVGAVGNLRTPKGYQYLLPAFREVYAGHANLRLVIAGEGPLRKDLVSFAQHLGLSSVVSLPGFHKNLRFFYSALDLFVMPSLWEGMPVALLEAMSYGLPVIATSVSGIPEVVRDGQEGFLVEPANPQQIAERLLQLVETPQLRAKLGGRARERVAREFSREQMVQAYADLYRTLLRTL